MKRLTIVIIHVNIEYFVNMTRGILMNNYLMIDDKVQLYLRKDIPDNPVANIIINHGFAEHLNRYDYVTKIFNTANFGVYRYDLRGHGKTKSKKGYVDNFMDFVKDLDAVVNLAKEEYPDLPLFMLGHSMGGFITLLYGINRPDKLNGQIFSGAAVIKLPMLNNIKGSIVKLLGNIVPNMDIRNSLTKDICSVKEVVEEYEKDPLVLKKAKLKLYVEFLINGVDWIEKNIHKYNYPCLITHGEMDKIVPKEASIYLYSKISSKDKEIRIYDNLYHEILNEREKDKILFEMINWIYERIR